MFVVTTIAVLLTTWIKDMATKENPFNEVDELEAQIAQLQARKAKLLESKKAEAIETIQELIARYDLVAEDLFSTRKKRVMSAPTKRYYDPASGKEWSGRGKRPSVFKDKTADEMEAFLVK